STLLVCCFFFFLILRPPPLSTLFPYTTLFRSYTLDLVSPAGRPVEFSAGGVRWTKQGHRPFLGPFAPPGVTFTLGNLQPHQFVRSEEHTSELQSRENLVCRLLLEKKKKKQKNI